MRSILNTLICMALSVLFTSHAHAYPSGWSDDVLLNPQDNKNRQSPDIAIDGFNNVWATWDSGSFVTGYAEVLYTKRDSLGNCVIPETPLSDNVWFSGHSQIEVDASNNVQAIWRDDTPLGVGVWHSKLANDGSVLVASHIAVNGAGGFANSLLPAMCLNKYQDLNIIWDEYSSGYTQMNFTKLDTMGNEIITHRISLEGVYTYWPGIGVDSFANVHMGYRSDSGFQGRFTYTKVDKDGNITIDNKFLGTGDVPTFIADHSQNIHVVYADPAGPGISIKYMKLDQLGNILVGPKILDLHLDNYVPHLAMDSLQYLHAVWPFYNGVDTSGLMYVKLDTLGNFVISPMPIVYPPYGLYPYQPRIAVDRSNRLHVVWMDQRLNPGITDDIFYKRGENDQGVQEMTWRREIALPEIAISPNPFHDVTHITYTLTDLAEFTDIDVFDVSGRVVNRFHIDKQTDIITWHGRDFDGNMLPAGVYFVGCAKNNISIIKKMIKMK